MCKYCIALYEKHFANPKAGDLRIWWIPQVPSMRPFHYPVSNYEEAKLMYSALAQYDLYQERHRIKPDFSNAGGLEVYNGETGKWEEWEDADGNSLTEAMELDETLGPDATPEIKYSQWGTKFKAQSNSLSREEHVRAAFLAGFRSK